MRAIWLAASFLAAIAPQIDAGPKASPVAEADTIADLVVTARPGAPPPLLDAIGYYRRHCFDANRLTGRSAMPEDDPDWRPLDTENRRKFGILDPTVPAFGLVDPKRGHTLLIKAERLPLPPRWRTVEERCTLVVIGGRDHEALVGGLGTVWQAGGTQRNLDDGPDGMAAARGWRRWHWSGMPARGSKSWRALTRGHSAESAALRVVEPVFYAEYDYIMGDLKTKSAGSPISVLSFVRAHRPASPDVR